MNDTTTEDEKEQAYRQVETILGRSKNLAPQCIPTLVSLRDVVREPPLEEELPSSLLKPNHGHHALFRALEDLEKLENEISVEHELLQNITAVVTQEALEEDYQTTLQHIGMSIPRRVCQHPFKKNDIVWVCRTCQADETCVLCHDCYSHSNHEGHDVAFYHAQAGGCCDCGDPDAWDPSGFCPKHGPNSHSTNQGLDAAVIERVRGIVPAAVDWLVNTIANNAETAHARVKPAGKTDTTTLASRQDSLDTAASNNNNNISQDSDAMAVDLEHTFVPQAASTSKSLHGTDTSISSDTTPSLSQRLGADGLQGHGLYLILHADDIHNSEQIVQALRDLYGGSSYFTNALLGRVVRALRQYGQLVVYGTMELVGVCSNTHTHCWLDGDLVASSKIGSIMLEKAARLSKHGLVCSIATRNELQLEQRAVAVLHWLAEVARSCDPLCQTVAESILPNQHLVPMLRSDFKVSASITKAWHSLLLTLLAVPTFKSHLAAAYCDTYHYLTLEYASGMGVLERSAYTLSVQFLNRVTYVVDLVQGRDLLGKLGKALLETFSVALSTERINRLDPNHFVLNHRRYSPCISDLKCVLNVKGMARLFASSAGSFLQDWIDSLSLAQFMDGVTWRTTSMGHVEVENRGWVGAFNASISLGSLFERLLSWDDDDVSPIDPSQSILARNLLTCVELNFYILTNGLGRWQSTEMAKYETKYELTPVTSDLCPASLPFATVASKNGTHLAFDALPIAQSTEWSFHLPLHRFVAASLREACRRPIGQTGGMEDLLHRLQVQVPEAQLDQLFQGLMEFPTLVLTRAAQIRSGLWRRNGSMMHDQVLNYAEPPFCRSLRDADILLLQFALLGRRPRGEDVACALMVNLLLHRFGIFDFLGFAKAPNDNIQQYKEEVDRKLYNPETQSKLSIGHVEEQDIVLPWTYTPATDLAASLALVEEFLHLLIVLITELPSLPTKDNADHTLQAKQRLRREVVHRLASGPKTHSELAEVHHVLSHWDNYFLSEEGKLINPDDASGAALGQALAQVAERKSYRGRLAPHHWELTRQAWDDYDPSFFHISMRSHQSAAENRPKPAVVTSSALGVEARPFAPPKQIAAHPSFQRLERDITADATVLAVAYRTLHVHCTSHGGESGRDISQLRGSTAYHSEAMSETALSRVVHLLTLGAFAWKDARADDAEWRNHGGGSPGSIFHGFNETPSPTARDWVALALLSPPDEMMDSAWYSGEENMLLLLRRLAVDGGKSGTFVSQDRALRSGAAWLCEFAAGHNTEAAALIGSKEASRSDEKADPGKTDLEQRKQAAKQKAMERMKAQAAKFAQQMMDSEGDNEGMEESESEAPGTPQSGPMSPQRQPLSRSSTAGSESFNSTSTAASRSPHRSDLGIPQFFSMYSSGGDVHLGDSENNIPERLLKERPRCIICVDDGSMLTNEEETMARGDSEEGKRKRSRRKTGNNALAFVGYAQASTVQKGGGGPPPAIDDHSSLSSARRFAGTHVALCGHVMHSECCESYLASVSHREDRSVGRRDEFRCPLCQRLSNTLVPFIDAGVDWTDIPKRACNETNEGSKDESSTAVKSSGDDDGDQCMELDEQQPPREDLQSFLSNTPWWVARNDGSVVWDGQCAFIAPDALEEKEDDTDDPENMEIDETSPQSQQQRRRIRSLRKKDLYAAWTAMMRTPRFVRRRLRPRSSPASEEGATDAVTQTIWPTPSEETSGETVVWRRLMDLISDVAFKADGKRLGERYLHQYCGEFRHYIVEKSAYNIANREGGRSNVEWPACISTVGTLPDSRRQELSREKLLAKLLMSVQAFTYSSCCEAHEAKRVLLKEGPSEVAGLDLEQSVDAIYSKYGITGLTCDDKLVLMPTPSFSGNDGDGTQPFNGRLGKLRHFGLAVMAACGAVSADLVQLVMCFPLDKDSADTSSSVDPLTAFFDGPTRAPIVFPFLLGHVLTHVVAAMCAACGRARARSDCLELAWPAPFSRRGSFSGPLREKDSLAASVANDCEGFIMLGVLARMLQILLNRMDISASAESDRRGTFVVNSLRKIIENQDKDAEGFSWLQSCFLLLEQALAIDSNVDWTTVPSADESGTALEDQFRNACSVAASETVSFLSDVGIIFQMLVPGVVATFQVGDSSQPPNNASDTDLTASLSTLRKLQKCLGLEAVEDMLQSPLVHEVVRNWYETARSHARVSVAEESGLYSGKIRSRLYQTEGFRCFDWPMDSMRPYVKGQVSSKDNDSTSMVVDTNPASIATDRKESRQASNPLVCFSSKKSIQLLGGYAVTGKEDATTLTHPRVVTLATSYTDLYATLGSLCPDCDQTALCLICGEVLNAGGKGECTKHSYQCGGGACIFFLLQECVGLVLHGDLAAYVHSPYVDSHGETPQYRGRPLNLDLDRYNLLHEMWSGHLIRQKVVSERGTSRQVIIAQWY